MSIFCHFSASSYSAALYSFCFFLFKRDVKKSGVSAITSISLVSLFLFYNALVING